jgi:hypothetical protein
VLVEAVHMSLERYRRSEEDAVVREVQLENGGLIIYDTENEDAWLQAERPIPVG